MEQRLGKINISAAGGTASHGSKTYKLTLPSSWISELGLTAEHRQVEMSFTGKSIIIMPALSMEDFRNNGIKAGHLMYVIRYYDKNELCTLIYADATEQTIRTANYTTHMAKTAFGKKSMPTWADFMSFMEERCIPRARAGLREYLEAIGVGEYNPLEIAKRTKGHMAEDQQWLDIEVAQ